MGNNKYDYYIDEKNRKVIAVTHYAGRDIRSVATCAPEDDFNLEIGIKIATAKCEIKKARIKVRNASNKYLQAAQAADAAAKRYDDMKQYYMDAVDHFDWAIVEFDKLIKELI